MSKAAPVDPERSRRARRAALIRWAHTSTADASRAGRRGQAGLDARLLAEIDPDGTLPPDEAARRLARARRAHFIDLAGRSAKARRRES